MPHSGLERHTLQLDIWLPYKQTPRESGSHTSSTVVLNIRAPQGSVVSPLLFTLYTHDCTPRHQENSIPQSPARLRKILGPYPRQLFRQSTRNNSVWKHHKVVCFVRSPRLKVSAWEYHWYRPQSISAIDGVRCLHRAQRILTTTTPSTVCSKDTVPGDSYYSSTYSHTHTFFFFFFLHILY